MKSVLNAGASVVLCSYKLLIIIPLILLGYFYYPVFSFELSYYFGVQALEPEANVSEDFSITIPSLGLHEIITPNVNPFNQEEYREALYQGVAHSNTSVTPDQQGTVYLFAHNSDDPLSFRRYNTAFYRLSKISIGETINLSYNGNDYSYVVTKSEFTNDRDISQLLNRSVDQLVLQTCVFGSRDKRLLVYASKPSS